MSKYYGKIGFGITTEVTPGVYEVQTQERAYYGDVYKISRQYDKGEGLNDNLNINNEISILADPFACSNFHAMRYIEWMDSKWKITNVTVEYPRLRLSIGGLWNG